MARKRTISRGKGRLAGSKAGKKIQKLLPVSFRSHLKASIRECLLAFESLFDEAVKTFEEEGRRKTGTRSRRVKVE